MNRKKIILVIIALLILILISMGLLSFFKKTEITEALKLERTNDFLLKAQYGAGHSNWKSWIINIQGNGDVKQEVYDGDNKTLKLSVKQIQELIKLVNKKKFFDLNNSYEPSVKVTDLPTLILEIELSGKKQKVRIYGNEHILTSDEKISSETKEDVKRFNCVFNKVLELVPSPNKDQKSYQCN